MWLSIGKIRYTTSGVPFTVSMNTLVQSQQFAAAYGFYRLNNAYSGNSCRVRRSSDNVEADIDFNADGTLNETALTTHCGVDDGFVTTIYDQVGLKNITQTTAANQPKIVGAGAVVKINGSPVSLRPDTVNDRMSVALSNGINYQALIGSWSDTQAYEMKTRPSGSTFIPAGATGFMQLPPFHVMAFCSSPPSSVLLAELKARCQPDSNAADLFRLQFTTAGAKTLTVTAGVGHGITYTDSTGTQSSNSYSRTVAAFDWLVMRAADPTKITAIDWNTKTLTGCLPQSMFALLTKVTNFQCYNNQLTGSIPSLTTNTLLTIFRCDSNQLTGSIPSLTVNTALTTFYCFNNQLTGSIPSLTTNTALTSFWCQSNQLTGSIPSLTTNTALIIFYCNNNQLTGSIPSLTTNTALTQFYCYANPLTGSIPSLTTNTALTIFQCQNNPLTGSIPSLTTNTLLTNFRCDGNQLTGSIPSLTTNTALTTFWCQSNQLTGSIPSLTTNTALTSFWCNNNQLTGSIPSLTANTALTNFYCNNNQLTGSIPSLTANTALTNFYVHVNQLTGSIPSLTTNTALTNFYCFNNQLTGSIPSLTTNTLLGNFQCYFNQLTGSIPSLTINTLLVHFYCYNNQLTGSIPSLTTNTLLSVFQCYNNQLTGSIPSLTTNTALTQFQCYNNQLTGSIPSLTTNTALLIFRCDINQLTDWAGGTVSATLGDFQAQNNLLSVTAVNALLAAFRAAGKTTGTRTLNLGGTGNAAPTGQGLTDKAYLQTTMGWTVTTN